MGLCSTERTFDIVVVGAGIAGCSLACALSSIQRPRPFRIALLERSLEEPDRIVGELLQPGGVGAMKKLGLEHCLEGIDAVPVRGYCVVDSGRQVHIPYPGDHEGRSFHHGKFVMNLRGAAGRAPGVELIEATVTELLKSPTQADRVIGVRATSKTNEGETKITYHADLVIIADGCFSNFRTSVLGNLACKPVTKSHFIGVVLEDAVLPIRHHGTVVLVKNSGPVLLYQIGTHDTRILIDIPHPPPSDPKSHILDNIVPQLPSALLPSVYTALENDRLRRMPNSFLPSVMQAKGTLSRPTNKSGVFLIGDAWNMRHPLTGGGMTVAFNDVVLLRDLLSGVDDISDWRKVEKVLKRWHWARKPMAATVNILSVALYDLFGAEDEDLAILREGCFKYFERGGDCVTGPVSLLSAIIPSPVLLANHFFSVALYSIWVLFTHPRKVYDLSRPEDKPRLVSPTIFEYPTLVVKAISSFRTACVVFGPLVWSELRWWSPKDTRTTRRVVNLTMTLPLLCLAYWAFNLLSSDSRAMAQPIS